MHLKRTLSMVLAIVMVISMFAGISFTSSAAEGYVLASGNIAVGDKVIIALKSGDDYYAFPNANKSSSTSIGGVKLTVTDGVATEASNITFEVISKDNYVALMSTAGSNYIAFNSGKLACNGWGNTKYCAFEEVGAGGYKITSSNNDRSIIVSGTSFQCGTKAAASTLYIFKLGEIGGDGGDTHTHEYAWNNVIGDGNHTLACANTDGLCDVLTKTEACADAEPAVVAATCNAYATTTYTCDVCGYSWSEIGTEYGAHNYVDGVCSVCGAAEPAAKFYAPVTAAPINWAGEYIFARKDAQNGEMWIFNGTDAVSDYVAAAPETDDSIKLVDGMAVVTIEAMEGGYSLKIGDQYMYSTSGTSNNLGFGANADACTLEFTADGVIILGKTTTSFRFNASSGQDRFRFYKVGTTGAAYTYPTLYKLVEEVAEHNCVNTLVAHEAVAATCTEDGTIAYWECSECGKVYSDAAATTEITSIVGAAATGHAWGEWAETTAATCTEAGEKTRTCSTCNATETEAIEALGHNWGADDICTVCGAEKPVAPNFAGTYYVSVDGTYMSSNLVGTSTKRYEAVTVEGELPTEIPLAAADDKTFVIEKIEDGVYKMYAPAVEGDNYLTFVSNGGNFGAAADAFTFDVIFDAEAGTYQLKGTDGTNDRYLSKNSSGAYYGWYMNNQKYNLTLIPVVLAGACEHDWVAGTAVAATCTEAGYTPYTCSICGAVENRDAVDALGHDLAWNTEIGADGKHTMACSRCEYTELADCSFAEGVCTVCGAAEPEAPVVTPGWYLVEDYNLEAGTYALISPNYYAFNGTISSGHGQKTADAFAFVDGYAAAAPEGTVEFTFTATENGMTVYAEGYGYLYATKAGSGGLAFHDTEESGWSFSADGGRYAANSAYLRTYNNTFRTYSGKSNDTLLLAKKVAAPAHEHVAEDVAAVEATCTTAGATAGTKCSVCGEILSGCEAIAALGHDLGEAVGNEDGTHTLTCARCNEAVVENCAGFAIENGPGDYECSKCGYSWQLDVFNQTTDLANGDRVVIYHPTSGMALATAVSGNKLAGVAATATGTQLAVADGAAVMTVADLADGQFHLVLNGQYLTTGATGDSLSFADAPAEGATDYALWTLDTTNGLVIKNVNAAYNGKVQALEYFNNAFTTYSTNTTAAYQMAIYSDAEVTCTHANTTLTGAVPATCLLPGFSGDLICDDCGMTVTAGTEIPALGHSFVEGTCANCGATQLTATNVTTLTDGQTIYIYNAASGYVLTDIAAKTAGYFVGLPGTVEGNVLTTSSDALLLTVEVVEGGYKFKNNGLYLTYGDERTTLSMAADSDHAVWALDAAYHLTTVNSAYEYNGVPGVLYLQTYTKEGGYTAYATNSVTDYFVVSFYDPNAIDCDHQWGEGVVTTPATCVDEGVMTFTCALCQSTKTEVISATGVHTFGEDHICTVCGLVDPESIDYSGNYYIAAARSTGNFWWMTNDMSTGTRYTAVDSGLTELPAAISTDVDAAKVWTLTRQEDGTYLLSTGDQYSTYTSGNTAALGAEGKALTVTKTDDTFTLTFVVSETETRYLSLNGTANNNFFAYYKPTQRYNLSLVPVTGEVTPPAPEHTALWLDGQAATCTVDGYIGYFYCQECLNNVDGEHYGKMYSDEAMTTEITDIVIPAAHTWVEGTPVAATCTEEGYTPVSCSVCDATDMINIVDALGHDWRDAVEADGEEFYLAATCTETGMYTQICDRCGEAGADIIEIAALGHIDETLPAVAATCTETGLTEGTKCSVCGEIIVAQETVAALGHDLSYTNNGDDHTITCSRCDYNVTEAHSFVDGTCVCGAEEVTGPIPDATLKFTNKSLSLKSYTAFNCIARYTMLNKYDSYYVVFERYDAAKGETETVVCEGVVSTASASYHAFEYPLLAYMMNDTVTATLYAEKDGITYVGETYTNSVREYALSKFAASDEANKAVLANLLNYGAKAQIYMNYKTEALATDGAEALASYMNNTRPTTTNTSSTTNDGYNTISVLNKALGMNEAVELQFILRKNANYEKEDLYAVYSFERDGQTITGTLDGSEFSLYSGYINVRFNKLTAQDGRTPVSVTIYEKSTGTRLSETYTYSVESHVNLKLPETPTTAQHFCLIALMNFYDAVDAAF